MTVNLNLNAGALRIVNRAHARINELGLEVSKTEANGTFLDFGIKAKGGIQAGLELARACMSGLAKISLAPSHLDLWKGPAIAVATADSIVTAAADAAAVNTADAAVAAPLAVAAENNDDDAITMSKQASVISSAAKIFLDERRCDNQLA